MVADLGVTTGSIYCPPNTLREQLEHLASLQKQHPELEIVPHDKTHFTFLGISHQRYSRDTLPGDMQRLAQSSGPYLEQAQPWIIQQPRLQWIGSALVLMGHVDPALQELRHQYCTALLNSEWAHCVREKYARYQLPPTLWHSTLVRYRAPQVPTKIIQAVNIDLTFASIELPEPKLRITNEDWSIDEIYLTGGG